MPYRLLIYPYAMLGSAVVTTPVVVAADLITRKDVLSDERLLAWCVIGSIFGGLLAICIPAFSDEPWNFRKLIAKFVGSSISGFVFSPGLIHYLQINNPSVDLVVGISAGVAFLSVAVITACTPILVAAVTSWSRFKFASEEARREGRRPDSSGAYPTTKKPVPPTDPTNPQNN